MRHSASVNQCSFIPLSDLFNCFYGCCHPCFAYKDVIICGGECTPPISLPQWIGQYNVNKLYQGSAAARQSRLRFKFEPFGCFDFFCKEGLPDFGSALDFQQILVKGGFA